MSDFNTPVNAGELLGAIQTSRSTQEDQYICDREAYMKGRAGVNVESFYNQREHDMYLMGRNAYELLQEESHS